MPTLKTKTATDLTTISEMDLITELFNRDIGLDYIEGAYYSLDQMECHRLEEILGYSEDGLHGKQSSKPKPVYEEKADIA